MTRSRRTRLQGGTDAPTDPRAITAPGWSAHLRPVSARSIQAQCTDALCEGCSSRARRASGKSTLADLVPFGARQAAGVTRLRNEAEASGPALDLVGSWLSSWRAWSARRSFGLPPMTGGPVTSLRRRRSSAARPLTCRRNWAGLWTSTRISVSGSAALFHLRVLTRAEYIAYLQSVGFGSQRFAGLDGVGLVERVPAAQVRSFLAALREEGVAAPSLAPPGQRSQYCLGSYAAWRNLNSSVPLYGYDFCTVPSISQVLGRATRSGQQQVLTGSALGPAYASDFLLVQPVYAGSPISKAQREHQVSGWALGIINGPALLKSMPRQVGVQFLVFSGTGPARSPEPILRSPSTVKLNGAWTYRDEIDSDGTWDIRSRAAPGAAQPSNGSGPVVLLAVGLLAVACSFHAGTPMSSCGGENSHFRPRREPSMARSR